jgi:hypothetical protein
MTPTLTALDLGVVVLYLATMVGAPAFVALREGGGLRWLQYELALPLAMVVLIVMFLPALRSVPGSSIYAYAEQRFGHPTRQALAGSFLLSRGLSARSSPRRTSSCTAGAMCSRQYRSIGRSRSS